MSKEITIAEYADNAGVTKAAIAYRMKNKKHLPGVTDSWQTVNNIWVLQVSKMPSEIELQKYFRKK